MKHRDPRRRSVRWTKRSWLDEKIRSGELPAPANAMMQRCDAAFVARIDPSAQAGAPAAGADPGPDSADPLRAEWLARQDLLTRLWTAEA